MERCRKGERHAQRELYGLYATAMYNLCVRMTGDTAEAQDVLQESFIDAFTKLNSFKGDSTFGAWLKRIVVNNCISALRKKDRLNEVELPPHANGTPVLDDAGPELELSVQRIHLAIGTLPDGCRNVFTLYSLEGYDHQEISQIMGISVSTSKSQYHRARKLLQASLQKTKHNEPTR